MRIEPHFRYLRDMVLGRKKQWIIGMIEHTENEALLDQIMNQLQGELGIIASGKDENATELTPAEVEAVKLALAQVAEGKVVPHEEVMRKLRRWNEESAGQK
jgi:predicted transcriptional regulator